MTSYNDRTGDGDRSLKGEIVVLLSEGEGERKEGRDFPGGPVAKALCSQCRGPRVRFLVRELDPACHNLEFNPTTKDATGHTNTKDPMCHN